MRLHPKIRTSFGGGGGLADFKKSWKPENPSSPLWKELDAILKLGGAFQEGSFWMPTVYAKWPEKYDSFEYAAATGPAVAVYEKPAVGAKKVATLNYGIVKVGLEQEGWVPVVSPKGYVAKGDVRGPVDYRLGISKYGDRWLVDALVAGD